MPIGGGTFTVQNKILPGAYINFVSMGTNAKMGSRGVAALPLELNWGPDDKVFTMTATDFNATSLKVFGYDPTDANILLVREALKRAKSLLIYRVNGGGTKASATVGGMTVTFAPAVIVEMYFLSSIFSVGMVVGKPKSARTSPVATSKTGFSVRVAPLGRSGFGMCGDTALRRRLLDPNAFLQFCQGESLTRTMKCAFAHICEPVWSVLLCVANDLYCDAITGEKK